MNYQKRHFSNCEINPLEEEEMMVLYPKLDKYIAAEWMEDKNLDKIIRYVALVYDAKSPLIKNESDLAARKKAALSMVNIEDEELRSDIMEHKHPFVAELAVCYLMKFTRSKEWAAICAYEYAFWESIQKVMEPISGKNSKDQLDSVTKKSAIKAEIDADIDRLNKYYKVFFGEDEVLEKIMKKRISPESVANKE